MNLIQRKAEKERKISESQKFEKCRVFKSVLLSIFGLDCDDSL